MQRKSTASSKHIPTIIPGASRVDAMCILGVTICSDLKMDQHITRVLSTASFTLFALGTLRSKELPTATLHQIARATTLNSIMYASPAWWGYCNTQNRDRIEALLCRMKRRGFLHKDDPSACNLANKAYLALFRAICTHPKPVFHHSLTSPKQHPYPQRATIY